ncbi:YciI family protein [Aquincola tertiaricarbonis]|uniref:YciI family protein n=1 Tax=Aquincola tertiaricarbonis TaxID=391953 RepID=A0ABY4S508_AQUTE|nr:YciI family protein [Aquincola tertiaricarbonis]URI06395.1 YciI family protein [Aquincola tertiaricarbonis]
MQFMLVFKETTAEVARRDDPAAAPAYWGAWQAYMGAMYGSGSVVSGNALQAPRTATQVRMAGDKRHVQDGPFADTHEHLGGYVILETASLEDALKWAARAPCASAGSVEVRPVLPPPATA